MITITIISIIIMIWIVTYIYLYILSPVPSYDNTLFVYYNGKKYKKVKIDRKKIQNEILCDKLDEFFSPIKDIYIKEKLTKIEKQKFYLSNLEIFISIDEGLTNIIDKINKGDRSEKIVLTNKLTASMQENNSLYDAKMKVIDEYYRVLARKSQERQCIKDAEIELTEKQYAKYQPFYIPTDDIENLKKKYSQASQDKEAHHF